MEQTKTDPGRKKKKPLRRCGIFFACLLFLFLCSFVYISKNPRARMLLSVIYFMQDTLKDPAYIAYHIDIMELCQDYFNGDISFEGKAYLNDIKNFKYSSSMDISGERSFAQKKLSIISDMDVLTLNVGEMDFYMNYSVKGAFKKHEQEITTCLHGSSTTVASKQCRQSAPGNGSQKKEAL